MLPDLSYSTGMSNDKVVKINKNGPDDQFISCD
jgi:hypothetical protein